MAALEVSVAVSAVCSTFHSGAELLKTLRKTRKKRRGEAAYKEKALLESLENGEAQVQDRYAAHCNELGQSVRIGDAMARERLFHIAVSLQSEVIRSLQIATRNEAAVVDLTALHEASVMYRRDTVCALLELRQRLLGDMPVGSRQGLGSDAGIRTSLSSTHRSRSSSNFSSGYASTYSASYPSDLPPAVTIPSPTDDEQPKGMLGRVFSHRRSSSALTRRSGDSHRLSQNLSSAANQPWIMLHHGEQERQDVIGPLPNELPAEIPPRLRPPIEPPPYSPDRIGRGYFTQEKRLDPRHFPDSPRPVHPLERESLEVPHGAWREDSAMPTPEVTTTDAELNNAFIDCLGGLRIDKEMWPRSSSSAASISTGSRYSSSDRMAADNMTIASMNHGADDGIITPYLATAPPRARHSYTSIQNSSPFGATAAENDLMGSRPTTAVPGRPNHRSTTSAPAVTVLPPQSLQPPQTSNSTSTTSTSGSTMHMTMSGPTMLGRPCKRNNYYNFCKGAWSLREDFKKGLAQRPKPVGMYTSALVWQCRDCSFEGPSFGAKKPYITDPRTYTYALTAANGNPNDGTNIILKYKWLFLAKSHVKVKSGSFLRSDASATPNPFIRGLLLAPVLTGRPNTGRPNTTTDFNTGSNGNASVNSNVDAHRYLNEPGHGYGCIFCCAEGRVTGVFGNAETLLRHVIEAHASGAGTRLSEEVRARTKCVVGRQPEAGEEWDVCLMSGHEGAADTGQCVH